MPFLSGEFLNEDLHDLPLNEEDILTHLSRTLKEESEAASLEDQKRSLQASGFKVFAAQLEVKCAIWGSSINDVTHIWRFSDLLPPMSH